MIESLPLERFIQIKLQNTNFINKKLIKIYSNNSRHIIKTFHCCGTIWGFKGFLIYAKIFISGKTKVYRNAEYQIISNLSMTFKNLKKKFTYGYNGVHFMVQF